MIIAPIYLVSEQPKGTEKMESIIHLLNYSETHPNTKIRHPNSIIIPQIHRNGLYLSASKSCIHVGGNFYQSDKTLDPTNRKLNGAIHVIERILKNVMGSAYEEKLDLPMSACRSL